MQKPTPSTGDPPVAHRCDLCSQPREAGGFLSVKPGEEPVWVCRDCRHMLELQVDDKGTAGD